MGKFFEIVSQLTKLDSECKKALSQIMKRLELPKGYILVKPNSTCNHVFFVESGLTRTFYYKRGKDVTDWFSQENTFAVSIVSFITRIPDRRGIELLEPSLLYSFHHDDLEKLYNKYHAIERLGRKLVGKGMVDVQKRFDDLHFSTASQRYVTLLETNPTIINRAPLGMIASYLGVTQETLSRIRRRLSR